MRATRNRTSAATEVVEREEVDDGSYHLQFKDKLSWPAGKPIPVADLLSRLESLATELRSLEQEDIDPEELKGVASQLASPNLLAHKDKGVRAWTACALVDIFKLCAPDAPFSQGQLKEIFGMFLSTIIPSISDPSNPYNGQHLHVLKSLAEIKSIVLMADLPNANRMMTDLFTVCFDVLSGPSKAPTGEELSKNVEHHMTAMLAALVDEAQSLPNEVIDVILAQFLRADPRLVAANKLKGKKPNEVDERQSTLLQREAPPAYNMAKNICNSSPDKMAGYISQYFHAVIVDVSSGAEPEAKSKSHKRSSEDAASDDGAPKGLSEEDIKELSKAHRMLRELWRSSPGVLQNIIPQLEVELGAEDTNLRLLATETLGDMIAGIGAAGPPPPPTHNPVAYPSQSLVDYTERARPYNFLTTPNSPLSFSARHNSAYHQFLNRRNDKSALIRAAWVTGIARILITSAGGVGLDSDEEKTLLGYFSETLIDNDERVRLAAVKSVEHFEFNDIVRKLGSHGGVSEAGSILGNLTERVKDRKQTVRTEAMKILGKLWGVASGAIAAGNERVTELLGAIPSRMLDTYYINDLELTALLDRVMYESLLPIQYPPLKPKATANGSSRKSKDSQKASDQELTEGEIDKIRTERILTFVRDLEPKAKTVFFAKQGQQVQSAKYMEAFLGKCEAFNGGVIDKGEQETKKMLGRLIEFYAKSLPESTRAAEDLWKFAKKHDRRSYQLLRFAMAVDSDYRKVYKSIKEFTKRMEDAGLGALLETLTPIIYRTSALLYNRSHVPAIIEYTRTDENGLASTAHEVLKDITTKKPDVFKTHVQELCKSIEAEAPTAKKPNSPNAANDLKACTSFARKYPKELPKDRKFFQAMVNFALYGTPPKAAKHAVTIIMSCDPKKEMHAKDIMQHCIKDFEYGSGNYLSRLAALSQLALLGGEEADRESDTLTDIAINKVLLRSSTAAESETGDWTDEPDDDLIAQMWALKILVNRVRALPDPANAREVTEPVYKLLRNIHLNDGKLSKNSEASPAHQSWMRLLAAQQLLKLSCNKRLDHLLSLRVFNELATRAQDRNSNVRAGFVKTLMKYLGQERLATRFYAILFLLAFEPEARIKDGAVTWIKSRCKNFAARKDTTMEAIFARLISLLAHHPDFDKDPANLKDFVQYILFYLKAVANSENLSLIYHVAQRVKNVQDGIDPSYSENLYILSDLAQAVIKRYEELHGWSMQVWPGKMKMPAGIFAQLPNHEVAQEIALKQYVPDELVEQLDDLVRDSLRSKKRKSDAVDSARSKRAKPSTSSASKDKGKSLPVRKLKTPKSKRTQNDEYSDVRGGAAQPSSERRRSGRQAGQKSYIELSDDGAEEDDMEDWDNEADRGTEEPESEQEESDVEMQQAEESEEEPANSPEPTPEKTPAKAKTPARGKTAKKANGAAKGKAVSPAVPTRALRSRQQPARGKRGQKESSDLSDAPESD